MKNMNIHKRISAKGHLIKIGLTVTPEHLILCARKNPIGDKYPFGKQGIYNVVEAKNR